MRQSRDEIQLPSGETVRILHEDRSALAIDKPSGWLIAPESWNRTSRNLHSALLDGIASGDHWARSRRIRFLRFVHRLDAETSGVLLLAKSVGALRAYSELFRDRKVEKRYLAVVDKDPTAQDWRCDLRLASELDRSGCIRVNKHGEPAETHFRVLCRAKGASLVEVRPITGRTHQIRVHLAESGYPIIGDAAYGGTVGRPPGLALRAVELRYRDPFQRRQVWIKAPAQEFLLRYGFAPTAWLAGECSEALKL